MADQRAEQHHGFRRSREAGPGIHRELELRKGSEDTGKDRRSGAQEGRSGVKEKITIMFFLKSFRNLSTTKSWE